MAAITFGTSGWRGLIARDFTFNNVRRATQGIADFLNSEIRNPKSEIFNRQPVVILGHDTRFLGREFSLAAAEVVAAGDLVPLLCNRDAPTPVIAHTIRYRRAIGGINVTASHNPAEYQGLKFSTILKELEKQTGEFHSDRLNVKIPPEKKEALLNRLAAGLDSVGPFKVEKFITTDGYKFLLPNREWVAFRASGTEPLIRCYLEAKSASQLNKLRAACRRLIEASNTCVR